MSGLHRHSAPRLFEQPHTAITDFHAVSCWRKRRISCGRGPSSSRCRLALTLRRQAQAEGQEASSMGPRGPVVVIDNYDSFTYNLCQYLGDLGCKYVVIKNDDKTVAEVRAMNPRGVLVSPGPGKPSDSGICLQAVRELGPDIPLFGVCMGLQCIGEAFGGDVVRAPCGVMHGKTSPVFHTNVGVLEGLPNPFQAARYHSLVIKRDTIPEDLEITAWTEDGTIMAARHKQYPNLQGVQFHPESIITEEGKQIVGNFIKTLLDES
uniref:anthranilate synthase n=1 Tax=Dunaliella tertiolecta TaxID=3047 RepID=A0A7S3QJU2_DUNTE